MKEQETCYNETPEIESFIIWGFFLDFVKALEWTPQHDSIQQDHFLPYPFRKAVAMTSLTSQWKMQAADILMKLVSW